jgi:hypothetical protein
LQQWITAHPSNQTWAQRAKTGGAVPCPVCKTSLQKETDIYPIEEHGNSNSSFLWRMIQGLQIKCNAQRGCCTWKGDVGSYLEHLQCGRCGEVEPDGITSLEKGKSVSAFDDELAKECPPSPSTCSEIVEASTLEELSSDCSFDDFCDKGAEDEGGSSPEAAFCEDSVEEASTPLIKDLTDDKTMEASSNPEDPKVIEHISSAPISKTTMKSGRSSPKVSKNKKGSKRKQEIAKSVSTSCAQNIGSCMTPDGVRAYHMQCQAARYQMACAQQYMMAVQTYRMQQYYQQVRMATGSI